MNRNYYYYYDYDYDYDLWIFLIWCSPYLLIGPSKAQWAKQLLPKFIIPIGITIWVTSLSLALYSPTISIPHFSFNFSFFLSSFFDHHNFSSFITPRRQVDSIKSGNYLLVVLLQGKKQSLSLSFFHGNYIWSSCISVH